VRVRAYGVVALLHRVAANQYQALRGVEGALHVAERTPLGRHERATAILPEAPVLR
jgi:hypothetical protein